jgi:quercetin dioxygenase-like cupin family protein
MRFKITGMLLLSAVVLTSSAAAQTTPAPSAISRTVIAATKNVPLYFRAVGVTLAPGEKSSVAAANGILYQISGSTKVSVGGEAKVLSAGEGSFIAGGKTAALTGGSDRPSTFLHFFLSPAADLDRPETAPAREGIIPHSGTDSRPEAGRL